MMEFWRKGMKPNIILVFMRLISKNSTNDKSVQMMKFIFLEDVLSFI